MFVLKIGGWYIYGEGNITYLPNGCIYSDEQHAFPAIQVHARTSQLMIIRIWLQSNLENPY